MYLANEILKEGKWSWSQGILRPVLPVRIGRSIEAMVEYHVLQISRHLPVPECLPICFQKTTEISFYIYGSTAQGIRFILSYFAVHFWLRASESSGSSRHDLLRNEEN